MKIAASKALIILSLLLLVERISTFVGVIGTTTIVRDTGQRSDVSLSFGEGCQDRPYRNILYRQEHQQHQLQSFCSASFSTTADNTQPPKAILQQGHQQHQLQSFCSASSSTTAENTQPPKAILQGYVPPSDLPDIITALSRAGFDTCLVTPSSSSNNDFDSAENKNVSSSLSPIYTYSFVRATGMLKLAKSPATNDSIADNHHGAQPQPPPWIPIISDMEHVLVQNGWSFLDPDESEPLSAFDVDAANEEGLYQPKWGHPQQHQQPSLPAGQQTSSLGYSLEPWTKDQILEQANQLLTTDEAEPTRRVLLEGATDVPHTKKTHNGYDFSGSVQDLNRDNGIFVCAIGGLPLFATRDLSPTTASSGWLSFSRPLSEDHVVLVQPLPGATDQRVEVLCARTRCHIGHYFGRGEGYCINASALDYSVSKQQLEEANNNNNKVVPTETILLGAGCFWHVEFALQRLRGVVSTQVGYAGGTVTTTPSTVTYEEVCQGHTGHAEVVQVQFDPRLLPPNVLLDCFLAMHDPTKTRAHGKHAKGTGQYRSCILVENADMQAYAEQALDECQAQLGKELSTELIMIPSTAEDATSTGSILFHVAEERHQKHDEKRKLQSSSETLVGAMDGLSTQLEPIAWLSEYGKRSKSIMGSAETIQ